MKKNYDKQMEDFLRDCNVLFEAVKAVPQKPPHWAKEGEAYGTHYYIRLGKLKEGHKWEYCDFSNDAYFTKVIGFDFWNSIHAKREMQEKGKSDKPSAYDVLAGVYNPIESFEDFCLQFGMDEDSRKAEKIYSQVVELNEKLENIFTAEDLERLQEIQ